MTQEALHRDPLDTTAEVETPEHVRFHYHLAGPARRSLAYLIDLLVRAAIVFVLFVVGLFAGIANSDSLSHASLGLLLLVGFALDWGYYVFSEMIWSGRSVGKRALGLRVVTEGGHPLHFVDSVLRNLLRAVDFLPSIYFFGCYAVGFAVMAGERRFRRLGDLLAGTMVVVEERHAVAGPLRIAPPPTQKELSGLPQRLPLSGEDLDAIELFLRREGRLSPMREEELAEMVAPIYARRMGVKYRDARRFLALLYHRAHEKRQ